MPPPPPTTLSDLSPLARALAASLAAATFLTARRVLRVLIVMASLAGQAGGSREPPEPEAARPTRRRRLSPPDPPQALRLTETAAHSLPCPVVSVAIASDGAIAAADADAAVRVWPRATGRARAAQPRTLTLAPTGVAVADVIATADGGWSVLTRDGAGGGGEVVSFDGEGNETESTAVAADGGRPAFLLATDSHQVVVTDKATLELVGGPSSAPPVAAGGVRARGAAASPASRVVVVATLAPSLPVFSVSGRRVTGPIATLTPPGGQPTAVAAAGRATVAVACRDKSVCVFDVPPPPRGRAAGAATEPRITGTATAPPGTAEPYHVVAVSEDGATVVAAAGRALHVLSPDASGGALAASVNLPADAVALAWGEGGCVAGCDDGSVRVFSVE